MHVVEAIAKAGFKSSQAMIGTGTSSLRDTITLTEHAISCGFNHVLVLPPYYFKNPSEDGLFDSYERIIQACKRTKRPAKSQLALYL